MIGFVNVILNCYFLLKYRFRLVHAVKPHTDRVTGLVMSPDHNLIVTLSSDQMIFFFKVCTGNPKCILFKHF